MKNTYYDVKLNDISQIHLPPGIQDNMTFLINVAYIAIVA